jgi:hypothetical protein
MHRTTGIVGAALGLTVAALTVVPAQGADKATANKIHDALSAAPDSVARHAAVYDWPKHDGDDMPMLRHGTNGWSCMPDDPSTPTDDPQCLNAGGMEWMDAFMKHTPPHLSSPGLAYVLQGCSVASNTDPFAMHPAAGNHWVRTGPHVMVFPTGHLDRKTYGTDPTAGMPYIRWAGTPYEHLVVPLPAGD